MLENNVKQNLYPYIETTWPDLYKDVVKDIFLENLADFFCVIEKTFITNLNKEYVELSLYAFNENYQEFLKNFLSENNVNIDVRSLFKEKLSEYYKPSAENFILKCSQYFKKEISEIFNETLIKYSTLDIYPLENVAKLNSAFLKIIISFLEKKPENDYQELLDNLDYDKLVKKIIKDNSSFLKELLFDSFSDSAYLKNGIEDVKTAINEFFLTKLRKYLAEESESIINIEQLTKKLKTYLEKDILKEHTDQNNNLSGSSSKSLPFNSNKDIIDQQILEEKHLTINDGDKCITYENLFGVYLEGAVKITLIEPYLQSYYQYENLLQLCKLIIKIGGIKRLHIITKYDNANKGFPIKEKLNELVKSLQDNNIEFTYKFSQIIHDREISCDNGWTIKIGRGLHIYQHPKNDELSKYDPYFRPCHLTKVDIYKEKADSNQYQDKSTMVHRSL